MATTDKYDRQLRLWGAKGQRALGETTVVLLRASAAGTETLKNLVLPGIGRVVVVDDESPCTSPASNFFLSSSCQPRGQVALQYLKELNPEVEGEWKQLASLQEWNPENNKKMLVICADLEPPLLRHVANKCHSSKIPLIVVQAYGLIGSVRLQTPALALLEPKPENEPPDLRLCSPFDKFVKLAQSIQWDTLDNAQHGHVPYPLILYKVQQEWKDSHNGQLPKNFAEKQQFSAAIKFKSRNWDHELNFQEAVQNAYLAYTDRTLDMDHLSRLKQQSAQGCPKMHALLVALEKFLEKHHGQPPLHGTIPDMTASTSLYVELQKLYHDQAAQDVVEMQEYVGNAIPLDEVQTFCRNVFNLDLLETRTLEQEYHGAPDQETMEEYNMYLMDPYEVPEHTPFLWYIALRASHVFYDKHDRYPGTMHDYEQDVAPLQECIGSVVSQMKLSQNGLIQETLLDSSHKYAQEMVRNANAELHTIASVVGGVASQEAVKIITGQYVPFNNTYIYNGIASTGGVYNC